MPKNWTALSRIHKFSVVPTDAPVPEHLPFTLPLSPTTNKMGPKGSPNLTRRLGAPADRLVPDEIVPLDIEGNDISLPRRLDDAGAPLSPPVGVRADDIIKAAAKPTLFPVLAGLAKYIGVSTYRCWVVLVVSIFLEIFATTETKRASDASDLMRLIWAMSLYNLSLLGFAACLPKIEVGVAYAVWSALGTAAVSVAGMLFFGERADLIKGASILFIIVGVVGLNLTDDDH